MTVKKDGHKPRSAAVPAAIPAAGRRRSSTAVTIRDRGHLPHWELKGSTYFVTFRLVGSLPRLVLTEIAAKRKHLIRIAQKQGRTISAAQLESISNMFSARVEEFLDSGAGACHLSDPRVAAVVQNALLHFDGGRYQLAAWCIMPNHVHLLLKPLSGWSLADILHSIKSYSAKKANQMLGRSGHFWQKEYFDRIVRDEEHHRRLLKYIIENPARAGLDKWPWVGVRG